MGWWDLNSVLMKVSDGSTEPPSKETRPVFAFRTLGSHQAMCACWRLWRDCSLWELGPPTARGSYVPSRSRNPVSIRTRHLKQWVICCLEFKNVRHPQVLKADCSRVIWFLVAAFLFVLEPHVSRIQLIQGRFASFSSMWLWNFSCCSYLSVTPDNQSMSVH